MDILNIISENLQIIFTVALLLGFLLIRRITRKIIRAHALNNHFSEKRVLYTLKYVNTIFMVVILIIIAMIWDITFRGLSIYIASLATVLGVALFAQWSILSNITASVILFFQYTYKMGARIKIVDGDNSIVGKIVDINLFFITIESESNDIVSYPNSLAIQKPIVELKEN